jgi:hypothetical protein
MYAVKEENVFVTIVYYNAETVLLQALLHLLHSAASRLLLQLLRVSSTRLAVLLRKCRFFATTCTLLRC